MTLQIALLGTDGVLIASDTRTTTSDRAEVDPRIFGDEDKVILNSNQTVAIAWSDNKPSMGFMVQLAEVFYQDWGADGLLLNSCNDLWKAEKERERETYGPVDCNFIIAKSKMRQVYRVSFPGVGSAVITAHREIHMSAGLPAGQKTNSACFFTAAYRREKLIPIENLIRWAAYYILMGAKINDDIGGLTIHVSKNGSIFQRLSEEEIRQLKDESADHERRLSEFFFSQFLIAGGSNKTKSQPGGLA
jgi:hypothetical protein